jgi:putative flippase GtrA
MKVVFLYAAFAVVATVLNLLGQELSLLVYRGQYALYLAILAGTAVGLLSKYVLDKQFIFNVTSRSRGDELNRFFAYTLTGLFTTLVFWGCELGFEYLYGNRTARYTGAVIGLSIGYVLKYQLDKRFVFLNRIA